MVRQLVLAAVAPLVVGLLFPDAAAAPAVSHVALGDSYTTAPGLLELHQENFALPDESGMELLVLSAAAGSPTEDGLRLLETLGGDVAPRTGSRALGPHGA